MAPASFTLAGLTGARVLKSLGLYGSRFWFGSVRVRFGSVWAWLGQAAGRIESGSVWFGSVSCFRAVPFGPIPCRVAERSVWFGLRSARFRFGPVLVRIGSASFLVRVGWDQLGSGSIRYYLGSVELRFSSVWAWARPGSVSCRFGFGSFRLRFGSVWIPFGPFRCRVGSGAVLFYSVSVRPGFHSARFGFVSVLVRFGSASFRFGLGSVRPVPGRNESGSVWFG